MFEVLDEVCQPTRATKYSAGFDLYARESVIIGAGETKIVPLGVRIYFETFWKQHCNDNLFDKSDYQQGLFKDVFLKRHYLELHPRSSLRAKGLVVGVGIIDLDFKDEIGLIVHYPLKVHDWNAQYKNEEEYSPDYEVLGEDNYTINKGDKVAQILLKEHKGYLLGIESDVERNGGFGSTDKDNA